MSLASWPWDGLLPDVRPWIASSEDPAAQWALLSGVLGRLDRDPEVIAARQAMLVSPATEDLLGRLDSWDGGRPLSGHDHPLFAPNLLTLLADRGLRAGDDGRVDRVLARMLEHQEPDGHFTSFLPARGADAPTWGWLLCDSQAVVDVLLRYGYGEDVRVRAGVAAMGADLTETPQGRAWRCIPHSTTGFRGPGRVADLCPQVTIEALRALSRVAEPDRPVGLLDVARVSLGVWERRGAQKPYMFGHGKTFKTVKWPPTWYRVHGVLDALGRYPMLWRGPGARPEDRRSLAELAACLIAYNTDEGRVVPRSTSRGFESHSFGQKKQPSAWATALVLSVLHRLDDLAGDVRAVDVASLSSSRGGSGLAVPP